MARSEEKAKSALSRWVAQQRAESGQAPQKQKRPYLASLCDNLKDATKWRAQILREVASQVTLIQNGAHWTMETTKKVLGFAASFANRKTDFKCLFDLQNHWTNSKCER